MKYAIFKNVVMVQGHGAVLLLQVGSTVLCVGDSGRSNEGATLEIRLFAPLAEKWFTVKWRGLPPVVCTCEPSGKFEMKWNIDCPVHGAEAQRNQQKG